MKHLSDEQVAICAEAVESGSLETLSADLRTHLKDCDVCAKQVLFVGETLAELDNNIVSLQKKTKHNPKLWIGLAASVTLIVSFAYFANTYLNNISPGVTEIPEDSILKNTDTLKIIPQKKIHIQPNIANNDLVENNKVKNTPPKIEPVKDKKELLAYVPNDDLEKLSERFRESAMRGDDITIITPLLIEGSERDIVLKWENPDNQLLIVEILDNKGVKVTENHTSGSDYSPVNLKPGLYYWKLINEDYDLLFCGVIKVN